jgi:hypothetical protein
MKFRTANAATGSGVGPRASGHGALRIASRIDRDRKPALTRYVERTLKKDLASTRSLLDQVLVIVLIAMVFLGAAANGFRYWFN